MNEIALIMSLFLDVGHAFLVREEQGDFTFEANSFLSKLPEKLIPPATRYMAQVGRYIMSRIV